MKIAVLILALAGASFGQMRWPVTGYTQSRVAAAAANLPTTTSVACDASSGSVLTSIFHDHTTNELVITKQTEAYGVNSEYYLPCGNYLSGLRWEYVMTTIFGVPTAANHQTQLNSGYRHATTVCWTPSVSNPFRCYSYYYLVRDSGGNIVTNRRWEAQP